MSKERLYHPLEDIDMEYEEVLKQVDQLSDQDKQKLAQHLLGGGGSPLTVILGGHNVINNSVALQLNSEVENIAEQLQALPPETLQKIFDAIAILVKGNKSPKNPNQSNS